MQVEDAQDGSTAEALSDQRAAMLRAEALHARVNALARAGRHDSQILASGRLAPDLPAAESSQPTDLLAGARA